MIQISLSRKVFIEKVLPLHILYDKSKFVWIEVLKSFGQVW